MTTLYILYLTGKRGLSPDKFPTPEPLAADLHSNKMLFGSTHNLINLDKGHPFHSSIPALLVQLSSAF